MCCQICEPTHTHSHSTPHHMHASSQQRGWKRCACGMSSSSKRPRKNTRKHEFHMRRATAKRKPFRMCFDTRILRRRRSKKEIRGRPAYAWCGTLSQNVCNSLRIQAVHLMSSNNVTIIHVLPDLPGRRKEHDVPSLLPRVRVPSLCCCVREVSSLSR